MSSRSLYKASAVFAWARLQLQESFSHFAGRYLPRTWDAPPVRPPQWMEVAHYRSADANYANGAIFDDQNTWFYGAEGSGVWYFTGRMLQFNDTIDLADFLELYGYHQTRQPFYQLKVRLLRKASNLLQDRYDTISFVRHVDNGFHGHKRRCIPLHELALQQLACALARMSVRLGVGWVE